MKKVILQSLHLRNFKKIQCFTIDFQMNTEIHGKNGVGKSTIADAYSWLLYGKNQQDQTDFSIKTLDENNQPLPKLEHEVIGVFTVDDVETKLQRCYREKWTKKRGNDFEELTGHETTFFVNDVPTSASEYKTVVASIIDEGIAKIISNPLYFNHKMKWNERREVLERMSGDIINEDIVSFIPDNVTRLNEVIVLLNANKCLTDEKKAIQVKKKKLKDEIDFIPARLDETRRSKPEELNWSEIEKQISENEIYIQSVEKQIESSIEAVKQEEAKYIELQKEHFANQSKLSTLENELKLEAGKGRNDLQAKKQELQNSINSIKAKNSNYEFNRSKIQSEIERLTSENDKLREKLSIESAKQFAYDPNSVCCTACNRPLDNAQEKVNELQANFNTAKLSETQRIQSIGKANKDQILKLHEELNNLVKPTESTDEIEAQIKAIDEQLQTSLVIGTSEEIEALKKQIQEFVLPTIEAPDSAELKSQKTQIAEITQTLKNSLSARDRIKEIETRVSELNEQQKTLSQELATLERTEFQIDLFYKSKAELIESRVNEKFTIVKFKMFETQLNGGESPTCICTVDGVPFSDVNTASQINAGLDIINALQWHFGILAPVIIDGRESVTNLIKTECQIVSLIVDDNAKQLTVIN